MQTRRKFFFAVLSVIAAGIGFSIGVFWWREGQIDKLETQIYKMRATLNAPQESQIEPWSVEVVENTNRVYTQLFFLKNGQPAPEETQLTEYIKSSHSGRFIIDGKTEKFPATFSEGKQTGLNIRGISDDGQILYFTEVILGSGALPSAEWGYNIDNKQFRKIKEYTPEDFDIPEGADF